MQQLFVSLYLDEDVDVLVAPLLRAKGFTVQTARDAGMLTENDDKQLAYAVEHGFALATHNRDDFINLFSQYAASGTTHGGIVIAIQRSPYEIAQLIFDEVLNQYTAEEMQNRLLIV